jgi:hypothetical protein
MIALGFGAELEPERMELIARDGTDVTGALLISRSPRRGVALPNITFLCREQSALLKACICFVTEATCRSIIGLMLHE